jgi:2-amino-4-hydroxy-6-hydroxymethyldihydropteridine diphosphokinase
MNSKLPTPSEGLAFVALGSNMGDSESILLRAMERLAQFSTRPMSTSSLWHTTPVNCPPGSPHFVNAVVGLSPRAEETAGSFLAKLLQLEKDFGRKPRLVQNEPRRLDLDLISFGREFRSTKELTLPHPRACERRFVLQPLAEIAPDLILPGQTSTVAKLLAELRTREKLVRLRV